MSNGIDGVSGAGGPVTPKPSQSAHDKVERVAQSGGARDGSDVVSLTDTAEALTALQKDLSEGAPIDRQKVEAIKQALAAGEYKLDPERVAQKFLEIENALGKL